MNFNLSRFLSQTLKYLNIANKTIPLIKDVAPTVNKIKKINIKKPDNIKKENKKNVNSSITFFK